jgi:PST family polysaccharide transporter
MLKFGAHITGFDLVNYFHRNLDNILIGRFWGADMLGLYSRAYNLLMFPIQNIRAPLNAVAFPAMSRLQDQPQLFRSYYRRVTSLVALFSMPLCGFLFVAARPFIEFVLGERWVDAASLFQILAIVGFIQPSASLRGLVVLSLGLGRRYLGLGVLQAVVTSIGFLIGIWWGAKGIAIAYVISTYAVLFPMFHLAFKDTPLRLEDYVHSVARPVVAAFVGILAATVTNIYIGGELAPLHGIAVLLPTYCLTFLVTFVLLPGGRANVFEVFSYLKMLRPDRSNGSCTNDLPAPN